MKKTDNLFSSFRGMPQRFKKEDQEFDVADLLINSGAKRDCRGEATEYDNLLGTLRQPQRLSALKDFAPHTTMVVVDRSN